MSTLKFEDNIIKQSQSFAEFSVVLSKAFKQKKNKRKYGRVFERLSQLYLLNEPKYSVLINKIWLLDEVPLNVKEQINLPRKRDEGIDLIIETKNKEYWAVQSKFLSNPNQTLTRTKLNNFHSLAYVHCNDISHGIVLSTIINPPLKKELIDGVSYILIDAFKELDDKKCKKWKEIQTRISGNIPQLKPNRPRPYQKPIIKKVSNLLSEVNNSRGKLIMPCGTGKSLISYFISREISAKKILICLPSLYLVNQSLKTWANEYIANKNRFDYLCVCSDDTVDDIEDDSFNDSAKSLGIKVTTNKKEIKKFLDFKTENPKIVFTTYQSGIVLSNAAKNHIFDIGIFDEAHKTVGNKIKRAAHLIFQENIKISKRLFMTATERVYGGTNEQVISMDNKEFYGEILYYMSFAEAVEKKIICDYEILTLKVDSSDIENIIDSNLFLKLKHNIGLGNNQHTENNEFLAREIAVAIALKKASNKYKILKTISFHNSILGSKRFKIIIDEIQNYYKELNKIDIFHTSSKQDISQREVYMKMFEKSKNALITNARCLTEGVDIPAVDCVTFVDPKKSKVDIVQATGRAMRKSPATGKKKGYVIVPVIKSSVNKNDAFKDVLDVIGSLSLQDERVFEEVMTILGKKSNRKIVKPKIDINILKEISIDDFNKNIATEIFKKIKKFNYLSYEKACIFVQKEKIQNSREYNIYLDNNPLALLPASPSAFYANKGWINWSVFTQGKKIKSSSAAFVSYEKAKEEIQLLRLPSQMKFRTYSKTKRPPHIPGHPESVYADKWEGWGVFLGTGNIHTNTVVIMSLDKLRDIARASPCKKAKEWQKYAKKIQSEYDERIISSPESAKEYSNDWKGWDDFLNSKEKMYLTYDECKIAIDKSKAKTLKSFEDWSKKKKYKFLNKKIPKNIYHFYENYNFNELFTNNLMPFNDLRNIARSSGVKVAADWSQWVHKNQNKFDERIVFAPQHTPFYSNSWNGWTDFLGTKRYVKKNWMKFSELKKIAMYSNCMKRLEWPNWVEKNSKKYDEPIPSQPDIAYKKEWLGWPDFLAVRYSQKHKKNVKIKS